MRNPDKKYESLEVINSAMENGDKVALNSGLEAFAEEIMEAVNADMKAVEDMPMSALISNPKYNLRSLSSAETEFYKAVVVSGNTMTNTPLPQSIYERVFEDLKAEHPLLSKIQFINTSAVTEFVIRDSKVAAAAWGKLCDEITKQIDMAFIKKTLNNNKLSAFVNLCKSMLAIGPEWLDRFVREVLAESIAVGLEKAIVAGTGKDQPIGMIKDLAGAVVDGVYPDKSATTLTSLDTEDIAAEILAPMTGFIPDWVKATAYAIGDVVKAGGNVYKATVAGTSSTTAPSHTTSTPATDGDTLKWDYKGAYAGEFAVNPVDLLFIVNPYDYYNQLLGAFVFRNQAGEFILDKNAFGASIIQSAAVPQGKMVVGKAKDYFLGLAAGQNVSFSDDYRFLEDDRVYVAKMLAHGEPVNNNAFQVYNLPTA